MLPLRTGGLPLAALLAGLACGSGGDGGTEPDPVSLSGTVRDYFTGGAVGGALLAAGGQVGTTTSNGAGAYSFATVPPNSNLQVIASLATYTDTRNESVPIGNGDATADLFIILTADLDRQFAAVGVTKAVGASSIIIELDDAGLPREGIPLADITLVDTNDDPVGSGPYIFGAAGDIVTPATLAVTTAFNGRSRIAFLNVPAGRTTLRVQVTDPDPATLTLPITTSSNGITLGRR